MSQGRTIPGQVARWRKPLIESQPTKKSIKPKGEKPTAQDGLLLIKFSLVLPFSESKMNSSEYPFHQPSLLRKKLMIMPRHCQKSL